MTTQGSPNGSPPSAEPPAEQTPTQNPIAVALQTIALCNSLLSHHIRTIEDAVSADALMDSMVRSLSPELHSSARNSLEYALHVRLMKIARKFLIDYQEALQNSKRVQDILKASKGGVE